MLLQLPLDCLVLVPHCVQKVSILVRSLDSLCFHLLHRSVHAVDMLLHLVLLVPLQGLATGNVLLHVVDAVAESDVQAVDSLLEHLIEALLVLLHVLVVGGPQINEV